MKFQLDVFQTEMVFGGQILSKTLLTICCQLWTKDREENNKTFENFYAVVAHDNLYWMIIEQSIVLSTVSLERLTEEARLRKKECDRKIYLCEIGLSWTKRVCAVNGLLCWW